MALTPEQREQRKDDSLYSSDIARIMTGQSVLVAKEKLGLVPQWEMDALEEIDEIALGQLTEPFILDAYKKKYGVELRQSPEFTHPVHEWMGSHPDAAVTPDEKVIVEAKTVGVYNIHQWGNPGTDQVNFYTLWQSVEHMACADADRVDVVACFMTLEATKYIILKKPPPIHVFHIYRDYEAEDLMVRRAKYVRDFIAAGQIPPPDTLKDADLIWSKAKEIEVQASEDIILAWNELSTLNYEIKELQKKADAAELKIKSFMGDASVLKFEHQVLATWKNDRSGVRLNQKKLAEEQEEIYKQYLEPKEGSRRFLMKNLKK